MVLRADEPADLTQLGPNVLEGAEVWIQGKRLVKGVTWVPMSEDYVSPATVECHACGHVRAMHDRAKGLLAFGRCWQDGCRCGLYVEPDEELWDDDDDDDDDDDEIWED